MDLYLSLSLQAAPPPEKKRKETLLSAELNKYLEKRVRVKFQGGREGLLAKLASGGLFLLECVYVCECECVWPVQSLEAVGCGLCAVQVCIIIHTI